MILDVCASFEQDLLTSKQIRLLKRAPLLPNAKRLSNELFKAFVVVDSLPLSSTRVEEHETTSGNGTWVPGYGSWFWTPGRFQNAHQHGASDPRSSRDPIMGIHPSFIRKVRLPLIILMALIDASTQACRPLLVFISLPQLWHIEARVASFIALAPTVPR